MSRHVSKKNRLLVQSRSLYCCEYCKVPEIFTFLGYEIDHIIPIKHGGSNKIDNLAWTCPFCNKYKGTDVGTFLLPDRKLVRFYNPRLDKWDDHFEISGSRIDPKTSIGHATVKIFQFNHLNRLEERELLVRAGLFPPPDFSLSNYTDVEELWACQSSSSTAYTD